MLLSELKEEYFTTNLFVRSPETRRLLTLSVAHFGRYLGRDALVSDLTDTNLSGYIQARRAQGRAETTIEREASKLLCLWRFAAASGTILPPRTRLAKAKLDTPVAFMRPELYRLFRAAKAYHLPICGVPGNVYMLALLDLIWDTAERVGAIRDIKRSDVDLPGRWVTIRTRKNSGRTLVRKIRRQTANSLQALIDQHDDQRVFGPLHRTSLYLHLNRILKAADLPQDRKHKFHCLRRSHASYLHQAGGDSRASLDHSSEQITRDHYLDPRVCAGKQPISYLFEPRGTLAKILGWCGLSF